MIQALSSGLHAFEFCQENNKKTTYGYGVGQAPFFGFSFYKVAESGNIKGTFKIDQ